MGIGGIEGIEGTSCWRRSMFSISRREILSTVVDFDLDIVGRMIWEMLRFLLCGKLLFGFALWAGSTSGMMLSVLGM